MSFGGSETTEEKIPEWLSKASQDVVSRANAVSDIGYTPYMGPEVAAFNKAQEAAFNNNGAMAADLGLSAPSGPSMPDAQDFGNGIWGYGSYAPYMDTMEKFREERPGQANMIDSFFIDPETGGAGDLTMRRIMEARNMAESGGGGGGSIPAYLVDAFGSEGLSGHGGGGGSSSGGGGLFGGYSGLGDMTDGGGPGRSGDRYAGGGLLSGVANARNDISTAITGRNSLGGSSRSGGSSSGGGLFGGVSDFFGGIFG